MARHEIVRVRRDVVRRRLQVARKEFITPRMLRIVFRTDELQGFESPAPDDHIKIFLPDSDGNAAVSRDFTPRAWNLERGELTLDFALHPTGPAVDWARDALVADTLQIGGPRGSAIVPNDFDWYLLIGDATALPAIARRMEAIGSETWVDAILLVENAEEQAYLAGAAGHITWVHATGDPARDVQQIIAAMRAWDRRSGDGFVWIGAEAAISRVAYQYAVDSLQQPKKWIKAAAYWSAGGAEAGERIS